MKYNYLILTAIAFLLTLTLFSCKKQEQETLTPKITNDKVETTATTATFTWTVDWRGKLISVVEVSENEDMSHSQCYGSETETDNHDFSVTVTDLKEATKYYYRYLVWNKFYVDNKFEMEVKSFVTKVDVPKVKTVEVTDVTRTTATVIGEVTDDCGSEVTERGVCWSTSHNPSTNNGHISSGFGLGTYSVALSNLEVGKTYYVRAYAKNSKGTAYGDELDFVTGDAVKPTVTTAEVTNIDWRTATGGGEVTDDGDATVTERGICWSTLHNPEVSGDHVSNGTGIGSYIVNMTGLTAGTIYYVRAYAKNNAGLSYGNEVSFMAKDPEPPVVITNSITDISWTTANGSGEVVSDGGMEVTERGICWSTTHDPEVNDNYDCNGSGIGTFNTTIAGLTAGTTYYVRAYARNSIDISYGEVKEFNTLSVTAPELATLDVKFLLQTTVTGCGKIVSDGGADVIERGVCWATTHDPTEEDNYAASTNTSDMFSVGISGLTPNTKYYIRAYAKNNNDIGYGNELSFTTLPSINGPNGSIDGKFSVSSTKQVWFSQGNLQYQASTNIWRFAENQWNYVGGNDTWGNQGGNVSGSSNNLKSSTYSGWIDLFCWGTSGYNHGATCYKPWQIGEWRDFLVYGSINYNLYDQTGKADWGYNKISNGGNQENQWRTLRCEEWIYLIDGRNTNSGIRYAKATVNEVEGIILVPDGWCSYTYQLNNPNIGDGQFGDNVISLWTWNNILEKAGAVFLPEAGYMFHGTDLYFSKGKYFSSTYNVDYNYHVRALYFNYNSCYGDGQSTRDSACSVRLVRDVQ